MMKLSREPKLGRHLLVVEMRIDGKEGKWFEVGWHNMCGELDANGSRKSLAPRLEACRPNEAVYLSTPSCKAMKICLLKEGV